MPISPRTRSEIEIFRINITLLIRKMNQVRSVLRRQIRKSLRSFHWMKVSDAFRSVKFIRCEVRVTFSEAYRRVLQLYFRIVGWFLGPHSWTRSRKTLRSCCWIKYPLRSAAENLFATKSEWLSRMRTDAYYNCISASKVENYNFYEFAERAQDEMRVKRSRSPSFIMSAVTWLLYVRKWRWVPPPFLW